MCWKISIHNLVLTKEELNNEWEYINTLKEGFEKLYWR